MNSDSKAQTRLIPETMASRVLVFLWSAGPLDMVALDSGMAWLASSSLVALGGDIVLGNCLFWDSPGAVKACLPDSSTHRMAPDKPCRSCKGEWTSKPGTRILETPVPPRAPFNTTQNLGSYVACFRGGSADYAAMLAGSSRNSHLSAVLRSFEAWGSLGDQHLYRSLGGRWPDIWLIWASSVLPSRSPKES